MNQQTGEIYVGWDAIREAQERGEDVEPIGPGIAERNKAFRDIFDAMPKVSVEDMQADYARRLTAATLALTEKEGK